MAHRLFVSASRRTDIPAWYSDWFIRRIRAGSCRVRNPFRPSQEWVVDLSPEAVKAVFFWTRNPAPLLPHLPEIHGYGHRTIFHFTVTALPPEMEPGLAPLKERIAAFRILAQTIGPERVWWRYDPIILSPVWTPEWHCEAFSTLAQQLRGATNRVTFSLVDWYRKTARRLEPAAARFGPFARADDQAPEGRALVARLAAIAALHNMRPVACCEPGWAEAGVDSAPCIDAVAAGDLFGFEAETTRDPGQRTHCQCAPSFDIGAPHTCLGGCLYCYATSSHRRAQDAFAHHDPSLEGLHALHTTVEKDG